MGDADSPQEPVKPSIEDGKEQNQEPVTENSMTDDSSQKPTNKAGVYLVIGVLIVITAAVILSKFPIPADWVGMATSEEKSQVAIEEVNGKIIKTTTTIKTEPAKTLWDWMSLLLAPATLAALGFVFQSSQEQAKVAREEVDKRAEAAAKKRAEEQAQAEKDRAEEQAQAEKERAEDRLRADSLEAYINSISDLLVGKSLSVLAKQKARGLLMNTDQDLLDAGMDVIRARTLSIFRRFTDYKDPKHTDGERKGGILLFLYETGLIRNQEEDEQRQEDTEPKQFQALLSLSGANLSRANLSRANLICVNLSEADLSNANLDHADLSNAKFRSAKLCGADFTHAKLCGASLSPADLSGAKLTYADLSGAKLTYADLSGADLSEVDLTDANLDHAHLSEANLCGANFKRVKLERADLSRADLSEANLSGADFLHAKLSGAILLAVDLSQAKSLILQQLEAKQQPLLCRVKLPRNIEVDPNRDCKNLPEILLSRYPIRFKNLAEAQAYVYEQSML